MDSFAIGFVVGIIAGVPLFYSAEAAIAVVLQVGIALSTAILGGSFDVIHSLFQQLAKRVEADPNLVVGLIVGLLLVGISSPIIQSRNRTRKTEE